MKKAPLILMALNGLVWGGLSWMGWGAMKDVLAQHVVDYPNAGQIGYYLVFPLAMVTASLVPGALLGQTKWSTGANIWCSLTLIVVFPYMLSYTGGV